jgi:hypothetical protein
MTSDSNTISIWKSIVYRHPAGQLVLVKLTLKHCLKTRRVFK